MAENTGMVYTDPQNYTNIAEAIRAKTGTSDAIYPEDMDTMIMAISTSEIADIAESDTNGSIEVIMADGTTKDVAVHGLGGAAYTDASAYDPAGTGAAAAAAVKDELLNGAGEAYDTLKELGALIDENTDAITALETVATGKQDKLSGSSGQIVGFDSEGNAIAQERPQSVTFTVSGETLIIG